MYSARIALTRTHARTQCLIVFVRLSVYLPVCILLLLVSVSTVSHASIADIISIICSHFPAAATARFDAACPWSRSYRATLSKCTLVLIPRLHDEAGSTI